MSTVKIQPSAITFGEHYSDGSGYRWSVSLWRTEGLIWRLRVDATGLECEPTADDCSAMAAALERVSATLEREL